MDKTSRIRGGHVADQLSAYLDDELNPALRGSVDSHLASCAECSRELATLRATRTALREMAPVALPRSFILTPEVVAPSREERISPVLAWLPRLRLATAAMAILLVVVLSADALDRPAAPASTFSQMVLADKQPAPEAPAAAPTATTAAASEMAEPTATTAASGIVPGPSNDGAGSAGDTAMADTPLANAVQPTLEPITPAPKMPDVAAAEATPAMASAAAAPTATESVADLARNGGIQAFAAPTPTAAVSSYFYKVPGVDAATAPSEFASGQLQAEQPVFLQWLWLEIPIGLVLFSLIAVLVIFSRQRT